jgi:hypothetical protein
MVPKIRDLISDYERSMKQMKTEEARFKEQFKQEYMNV